MSPFVVPSAAPIEKTIGGRFMKVAFKISSWVVFLVLCMLTVCTEGSEWKDKAESEGKLIWYCTMNAADAKRIVDGFKHLYPRIDAQFYRATDAQLMERIRAEGRSGKVIWDVVSTTGYYMHFLKKNAMIAPYDSPERKQFRPGQKDPQAMWTSIYTNYTVLGYNTRLVRKENVPKSHFDLLKPVCNGQIGLPPTAYEWFAVFLQGMGREKGIAFMRDLAKQQLQMRSGRTLLAQLVAAGEMSSALAGYGHNFESLKREGAPVDWVPVDPVYGNLNPMGFAAQAPHPSAGKLFIDFVLSKAGQEVIRAERRVPDRIDVVPDPPKLVQGGTAWGQACMDE
jgi:iron(III) transport system substrate-binding protein